MELTDKNPIVRKKFSKRLRLIEKINENPKISYSNTLFPPNFVMKVANLNEKSWDSELLNIKQSRSGTCAIKTEDLLLDPEKNSSENAYSYENFLLTSRYYFIPESQKSKSRQNSPQNASKESIPEGINYLKPPSEPEKGRFKCNNSNEQLIDTDFSDKQEVYASQSSGNSTPHKYTDYVHRLHNILLINFDDALPDHNAKESHSETMLDMEDFLVG